MKALLLSTSLFLIVDAAVAEDATHTNVIKPEALVWKDNPAFPKNVQIATLVGDPTKVGETVVLRIKFPANFQMPPQHSPLLKVVTIISGHIGTNGGEKVERVGGLLGPGSMWVYPAKHPHYAWTGPEEGVSSRSSSPAQEVSTTSTLRMIPASIRNAPNNRREATGVKVREPALEHEPSLSMQSTAPPLCAAFFLNCATAGAGGCQRSACIFYPIVLHCSSKEIFP